MDIPELLPVELSFATQISNVKTNIIKMLVNRGFINKENEDNYIKKLVENSENNEMEYIINIDNDKNYNTEILNKRIYIKFFDYKIMSVSANSPISNFIAKYFNEYKILIVDGINAKTELTIKNYKSQTEIFIIERLKKNIIEHTFIPQHIVLSQENGEKVRNAYCALKKDLPLILSNDPIAKYYNMKLGDVCKIIRLSKVSGRAFMYRICVDAT